MFVIVHIIPPIGGSWIITDSYYQGVREMGRGHLQVLSLPRRQIRCSKEKKGDKGGGGETPQLSCYTWHLCDS